MMINKDKKTMLSVIIPAHNAEKFIEKAIKSVITQEDIGWELIIVENGSQDHTTMICERYAKADPRIVLLHSDKGVSCARNEGILHARGEWICFLDADDWLYDGAFSCFVEWMKNYNADLYLFGHNSEPKPESSQTKEMIRDISGSQILKFREEILKNPTQMMTVWSKLIRTSMLKDNDLLFNQKLALSEDSEFIFRVTKCCERICVCNRCLYHYSLQSNSTIRSYTAGMDQKYLLSLYETEKLLLSEPENIKKAFKYYVLIHLLLILVHDTFAEYNPNTFSYKMKEMKRICTIPIFQRCIKQVSFSDLKSMKMIPAFFIKYHCYYAAYIIIKIRILQNKRKMMKNGDHI